MIGELIAHFRIVAKLGQGGMGVVYRAEDQTLRRMVALKLLPDGAGTEEARQRFLREARSSASITHPNVAVIYQIGEADRHIYIAMELVEGENLRARLARGPLGVATAREVALQIARGLSAAHEKGLVHRDLKPENVMITPSGVVKLLDFGLAKSGVARRSSWEAEAALAKTETFETSDERIIGTPEYMSPEQALGESVDVRSDVFSFGTVFYEMLAGARPFDGATSAAVFIAIARDAAPALRARAPDVDEATEGVVLRCLAKAPSGRFGDAGEIVNALTTQTSRQTSPKAAMKTVNDPEPVRPRRAAPRRATALPVEELHPFPSPTTATSRATEFKSTLLVASVQALRSRGHFERYRALLPAAHADSVLNAVAGIWLPIAIATVHYTAAQALGLPYAEVAHGGAITGERIQASLLSTVAVLARTSGVTPWTVLAQFQRLYERIFRGGGGTRVLKLGPKEAQIDIVGMPLASLPYFRAGFQGMIKSGGELFCTRAYVSEVPDLCTGTTIAYRCAWV